MKRHAGSPQRCSRSVAPFGKEVSLGRCELKSYQERRRERVCTLCPNRTRQSLRKVFPRPLMRGWRDLDGLSAWSDGQYQISRPLQGKIGYRSEYPSKKALWQNQIFLWKITYWAVKLVCDNSWLDISISCLFRVTDKIRDVLSKVEYRIWRDTTSKNRCRAPGV